jgi:Clustered mitochondria
MVNIKVYLSTNTFSNATSAATVILLLSHQVFGYCCARCSCCTGPYDSSDEAAAKALNNDLKGAVHVIKCGIPQLRLALQALIDYKVCIAMLYSCCYSVAAILPAVLLLSL